MKHCNNCGRPCQAKAFTLVELLVVIGIIALLISILLPSLNKAREAANGVQCLSNLRQVGLAVRQYSDENKGFLPPAMGKEFDSTGTFRFIYWPERIAHYINKKNTTLQVGVNYLRCPSRGEDAEFTYGINYGYLEQLGPWYRLLSSPNFPFVGRKLSRCKVTWFLFTDTWGNIPTYPLASSVALILTPAVWPLNEDWDKEKPEDSNSAYIPFTGPYNGIAAVHGHRSANFVFVDGSASPRTIREWAANEGEMWQQ